MISRIKSKLTPKRSQTKEERELQKAKEDILHAAESGNVALMTELARKHGSDPMVVNTRSAAGLTPFMIAAMMGNIKIVESLLLCEKLDANAHQNDAADGNSPRLFTSSANTALHFALLRKHVKIVELLLTDHRLNLNVVNRQEQTPLMFAVEYCPEAVPLLLASDEVDVNARDNTGKTALHYACLRHNPYTDDKPEYLQKLISDPRVNLDEVDGNNMTPLILAENRNDGAVVAAITRATLRRVME